MNNSANTNQKKHIVIGLTGQTGAGKTTVSGLLRNRLFRVIDADVVARSVVEQGKKCLIDLVLEFGVEILEQDGSLNRRRLAGIIFGSKEKRMRFNELIFPYIQEEIQAEIAASVAKGYSVIFLDAPTLFESGSEVFCDKVVSVIAPKNVRRERLLARDTDRTMEEIDKRIDAQHDDEFYISRSDFVINNDTDVTNLRFQVVEMLEVCFRGIDRPDKDVFRDAADSEEPAPPDAHE